MLEHVQSIPLRSKVQAYSTTTIEPAFSRLLGRVVQVGIALYLLPVLLATLAAGVFGILLLAVRELFWGSVSREACVPRERSGLEIFRG